MSRIFVSELLSREDMLEISRSWGVELIRYSIAAELDALEPSGTNTEYACPLILHGPFLDLNPASWDRYIRRATLLRFHQAYLAARDVGAEKLVLHTGFIPRANFTEGWAPRTADFFIEFMRTHSDVSVALENVYDPLWEPILEVWQRVNHPRFGLCLDVGHAHCYSNQSVVAWADKLLPALSHVHLHDNHGPRAFSSNADEHLALGDGTLPFGELMACLSRNREMTYTIECASKSGVLHSIEMLEAALL